MKDYTYFQKYNILYKHQFCFRKKLPIVIDIELEVVNTFYKHLHVAQNNKVVGIYFDLQNIWYRLMPYSITHCSVILYDYGIRCIMTV